MILKKIPAFRPQFISRVFCHTGQLKKLALNDVHLSYGAKMVPYSHWLLPAHYALPAADAHNFVRSHCGLIDLSYMNQFIIRGKEALKVLESFIPSDLDSFWDNKILYTVILNNLGCIESDLTIIKLNNEHFLCASNPLQINLIKSLFEEKLQSVKETMFEVIDDTCLISVQGPFAKNIIQSGLEIDIGKMKHTRSINLKLFDIPCRITRFGYTGEDGFEISIPNEFSESMVEKLLHIGGENICLYGLDTHESLRIEAGCNLYGKDINFRVTPCQAGINPMWSENRKHLKNFPGSSILIDEYTYGSKYIKIGFTSQARIPREKSTIFSVNFKPIGRVTSAAYSPTLLTNVGIGYIFKGLADEDRKIKVGYSQTNYDDAVIKLLPFVKHNYYID